MWTEIEEYFFDYERFEEMCVGLSLHTLEPIGAKASRLRVPLSAKRHQAILAARQAVGLRT